MTNIKKLPYLAIILLAILLAVVIITKPYHNGPPIRSDGLGHHVWVLGFKHLDFTFCKYKKELDVVGAISVTNAEKNICGIKYPPGVGLLQFPFVAPWVSGDLTSGLPATEHIIVLCLGAALLLFTCFFAYRSLLLLGCSSHIALIAIFVFLFGSGLFHYATYDASFSHIYSAFGASALFWLVIKTKQTAWNAKTITVFAVLVFWLYLVRQTNGALTLTALLLALSNQNKKYKITATLAWVIATACAVAIQVGYNFYATGELRISSYGQEKFAGIGTHLISVLFSYERGLVTYYPTYLVTIMLGIFYWRHFTTYLFIMLILVFAILYGSWHSWYLGGGMGHRVFVELAPMGMLVLGMSLTQLSKTKLRIIIPILLICVYITVAVMLKYWHGSFPFAGATKKNYYLALMGHSKH